MSEYPYYCTATSYSISQIVNHNNQLWIFNKKVFIGEHFKTSCINEEPRKESEYWSVFEESPEDPK